MKGLTNSNALEKIIVSFNFKGKAFDISAMVTTLNISESIYGDLYGTLEVTDNAGIIDNIIITGDEIINISFSYFDLPINMAFILNGIRDINIGAEGHRKTYQMELGSINDYISATHLVSKSYEGKSTDIIGKIFMEYFVFDDLLIRTDSLNTGKYIAPNISPKKVIKTLQNNSYDKEHTMFYMFQNLATNGTSILDSLSNMLSLDPIFEISPRLAFSDEIEKGPIKHSIGRPTNIIINDNINVIGMSSSGVRGNSMDFINLDSSSSIKTIFRGTSKPATNSIIPIRSNMYDIGESLVTGKDDVNMTQARYSSAVAFSINAVAYNTPAIPGLCVGHTIKLIIDNSTETRNNSPKDKFSNKYANNYIVSAIDHHFEGGLYTQNIKLSRGII
jgi:hypothetical protein